MRIARKLSADQEAVQRFLTVLGAAMIELSSNKLARPEFFVQAHTFIRDYIEGRFFKKEELLIETLEEIGFPPDDGPIGSLRSEQNKSQETAVHLIRAAEQWQAGDENARVEVGWATSEYTSTLRQHLERLKNLIFPLLEQNIPIEEEHKLSERVDALVFDGDLQTNPEKYEKLIVTLEEELADWR
jgi:hemerythrin-like domain-containing protein